MTPGCRPLPDYAAVAYANGDPILRTHQCSENNSIVDIAY